MAAVLGTNMASVWASKNLQTAQANMASSVERLSSGLRINRARDDSAGLSIANSLTQQINGANQGIRNINDGISMVQTAEGAIAAASEMAQRILTLATQGSNSNLSESQRIVIGNEVKSLWDSIGKIESRTQFSGLSLINASCDVTIQSSSVTSDTFTISSGAALENIHLSASGTVTGAVQDMVVKIPTVGTDATLSGFTGLAGVVDDYITYLDKQRSTLGAIQNQMEYAVDNITELSANLTAARSRIQDTDYASETASLTKGQILQQAATAMLAQANQMPNVILSLLK
jgi:flagellin